MSISGKLGKKNPSLVLFSEPFLQPIRFNQLFSSFHFLNGLIHFAQRR